MSSFPAEVDRVLRSAGWRPGRAVDCRGWREAFERRGLPMHDAADSFLREFGGLTVHLSGPGVSVARTAFELEPTLCEGEEDRFSEWGESIGRALYPLGELDHGRFFLGIDEFSEIYLVETWVAGFGRMPDALENLILGVRPVVIDDGAEPWA
ncbi:SUKH-3 domain-containing protein [Kitasatospora sp. RB6PN24]|uniref:SUKH-3 domain-containing protein n=1 Tax=Kitasatospora humi TaxID=2893891 RepID=UPI001E2E59C4|nr:SUKH-3 domain-containing protein [Kitasatospora humi]MCC9307941.1 SUKH-3 domain-containing protein [Kitasatospora humi]